MTLEELIIKLRLTEAFQLRPRIICSDGFSVSVQASWAHYCIPRNNVGPFNHVELGFPSDFDEILFEYGEDSSELSDMRDTIFPHVPIEVLLTCLNNHGDFKFESGEFIQVPDAVKELDFSKLFT